MFEKVLEMGQVLVLKLISPGLSDNRYLAL